jgi:hypothetical protein
VDKKERTNDDACGDFPYRTVSVGWLGHWQTIQAGKMRDGRRGGVARHRLAQLLGTAFVASYGGGGAGRTFFGFGDSASPVVVVQMESQSNRYKLDSLGDYTLFVIQGKATIVSSNFSRYPPEDAHFEDFGIEARGYIVAIKHTFVCGCVWRYPVVHNILTIV